MITFLLASFVASGMAMPGEEKLCLEPREIVGMCLHDTDIGAKLQDTMLNCAEFMPEEAANNGDELMTAEGRRRKKKGKKGKKKGKKNKGNKAPAVNITCPSFDDAMAEMEETMQFEKCFLQSMDWVDEEFMIKNETKTADFDSLPEGVREEVNPDTVYACAEEQMALMLENPEVVAQMEACSNDYSAEEMETLGYIALMQLSLKCFKDMITSSCDNQVRIMLGREMEG